MMETRDGAHEMRYSIFNGQLRTATAADIEGRWRASKPGLRFRCGLCGHRFVIGDRWRGVMANIHGSPTRMGNFLVCGACHDAAGGSDATLLARRADMEREAARRFWWLVDEDSTLEHLDRAAADAPKEGGG